MRLQRQFMRAAGTFALWAGYGAGRARRAWHLAALSLLWRTRWRKLQLRDLKLRVPADWGDVEEASDGGVVIHNRPKRYRTDGDAIWYSTAVELHIGPAESHALPRLAPMQETCRTIPTAEGPVGALLGHHLCGNVCRVVPQQGGIDDEGTEAHCHTTLDCSSTIS